MMLKKSKNWLILASLSLVLIACGGGGGSSPPAADSDTVWNQMVWDQDNWN